MNDRWEIEAAQRHARRASVAANMAEAARAQAARTATETRAAADAAARVASQADVWVTRAHQAVRDAEAAKDAADAAAAAAAAENAADAAEALARDRRPGETPGEPAWKEKGSVQASWDVLFPPRPEKRGGG